MEPSIVVGDLGLFDALWLGLEVALCREDEVYAPDVSCPLGLRAVEDVALGNVEVLGLFQRERVDSLEGHWCGHLGHPLHRGCLCLPS